MHQVDPVAPGACYRRAAELPGGRFAHQTQGEAMIRRAMLALACAVVFAAFSGTTSEAAAQDRAFGRSWGGQYSLHDWNRFYHYP